MWSRESCWKLQKFEIAMTSDWRQAGCWNDNILQQISHPHFISGGWKSNQLSEVDKLVESFWKVYFSFGSFDVNLQNLIATVWRSWNSRYTEVLNIRFISIENTHFRFESDWHTFLLIKTYHVSGFVIFDTVEREYKKYLYDGRLGHRF